MSTSKAKLTSKGQITIPVAVRKALRLREGDTVTFKLAEDGTALLTPEREADPFGAYAGALRQGEGKSIETIVEELREERGW